MVERYFLIQNIYCIERVILTLKDTFYFLMILNRQKSKTNHTSQNTIKFGSKIQTLSLKLFIENNECFKIPKFMFNENMYYNCKGNKFSRD